MKKIPFAHYYAFERVPAELHSVVLAEFAENGARHLVLSWPMIVNFSQDQALQKEFCGKVKAAGLEIIDSHSPWGVGLNLNDPDRSIRTSIWEKHIRFMTIAAESGAKTYTVHLESAQHLDLPEPLEELVETSTGLMCESLEKLLPTAEKCGIILTVENCFSPFSTPDQVVRCVEHFNSPHIKCCYDSGHAHYMTGGRSPEIFSDFHRRIFWRDNIIFEDHALEKMMPHVVTAHLHDNFANGDLHMCPGDGTIDWQNLIRILEKCPNLISLQSEVSAIPNCVPIARMCRTFRELLPSVY